MIIFHGDPAHGSIILRCGVTVTPNPSRIAPMEAETNEVANTLCSQFTLSV